MIFNNKQKTIKRAIRFRGKSIKDGRWVYGYYAEIHIPISDHDRDKSYISRTEYRVIHSIFNDTDKDSDGSYWIDIDVETLGQFTGLFDKNGREIYEGDYLKYDDIIRVVYYEDSTSQFKMVRPEYLHRPNRDSFSCCLDNEIISGYYSVFGNIYDNKKQ